MASYNMQSNAIREDYKADILKKTNKEIHDDMCTVFGPYATEAFITRDNNPYFTRDGLEVIRSLRFDNELAMYYLRILFQAVHAQGKGVGDGTTTLAMLYTNLYTKLTESKHLNRITRQLWESTVTELTDNIKDCAVPMTEEYLKGVLTTCTQDTELSNKIYDNLHQAIMERAYITIDKANIAEDFSLTVHQSPVFAATRQFSVFPIKATEPACTVLHCNGLLDIAYAETYLRLITRVGGGIDENGVERMYPKTVIILCNGITEATRRTLKEFLSSFQNAIEQLGPTQLNNLAIYTLDEYRKFSTEQIEDISTVITDELGVNGLVQSLSFESLLYQAFPPSENGQIRDTPELKTFDCDMSHVEKIRQIFDENIFAVDFDEVHGLRLHKELGPVATARYNKLREDIATEKSAIIKMDLSKRLRTMYGNFIQVEVGSKLIKDSQRKYELILDAVLSASAGVEHGVLKGNSILTACYYAGCMSVKYEIATKCIHQDTQTRQRFEMKAIISDLIHESLCATFADMFKYAPGMPDDDDVIDDFARIVREACIGDNFEEEQFNPESFHIDNINLQELIEYVQDTDIESCTSLFDYDKDCGIIEPVDIITTILDNSTTMLDLAKSRTFHLEGFMQNYI